MARIIKKHETLTEIPLTDVNINEISNRLVFKVKDWHKLAVQTPETMNFFGGKKKKKGKIKNIKRAKSWSSRNSFIPMEFSR